MAKRELSSKLASNRKSDRVTVYSDTAKLRDSKPREELDAEKKAPRSKDEIYADAFQLIAGHISEEDASDEVKAARLAILDGSWVK